LARLHSSFCHPVGIRIALITAPSDVFSHEGPAVIAKDERSDTNKQEKRKANGWNSAAGWPDLPERAQVHRPEFPLGQCDGRLSLN
jgi:hypothetical protein